jgi:hypothetical protein
MSLELSIEKKLKNILGLGEVNTPTVIAMPVNSVNIKKHIELYCIHGHHLLLSTVNVN